MSNINLYEQYEKAGYLIEDFRIFHLVDTKMRKIPFHYHDFHKIIFLLQGCGTYSIEGKTYELRMGDLIFVSAGEIHRPEIAQGTPYERIVIYIAPSFLYGLGEVEGIDLTECFRMARATESIMHETEEHTHSLLYHADKLEKAARVQEQEFAGRLYAKMLFVEFMILLNRAMRKNEVAGNQRDDAQADPKIQEVLRYIAVHLTEPLGIERIADAVYLSRFYLMRQFKKAAGRGIHAYIREKRLFLARERLHENIPIAQIAVETGFVDYSAFSRAFRAMFHTTPSEWRKLHK